MPKSRLVDEIIKLLLSGNAMKGIRELWETKLYVEAMPLLKDAFSNQTLKSSNLIVNEFLEVAFSFVDKSVSMQKPISLGFVFACLLWHRLLKAWSVNKSRGYREVPALHDAINKIIEDSFKSFPVQKRHLSDMQEIWILQIWRKQLPKMPRMPPHVPRMPTKVPTANAKKYPRRSRMYYQNATNDH